MKEGEWERGRRGREGEELEELFFCVCANGISVEDLYFLRNKLGLLKAKKKQCGF